MRHAESYSRLALEGVTFEKLDISENHTNLGIENVEAPPGMVDRDADAI
jgi:hypothetical protein